jgi:hypothetical protein
MSALRQPHLVQEQMPTQDLIVELMRLSDLLGDVTDEYGAAAFEYGQAESDYRKAKAVSYLAAVSDDKKKPRKEQRTIPALEATRDIECETERLMERLAKARKEAAKEKMESTRVQINALQSVCNAIREEIRLSRTGPER